MPSVGFPELLIILVVIALLFGASRLPKLARSIGQSAKEFRKGLEGVEEGEEEDEPAPKSKKAKKHQKDPEKTADSEDADED